MPVTIYHNPRCSKSRQTLALLEDKGLKPVIILYLETPPDEATLLGLLKKLRLSARQLLRKSEEEYSALGLDNPALDETALVKAMCQHPRLIERPIVVNGSKAALGRPPEHVLSIL